MKVCYVDCHHWGVSPSPSLNQISIFIFTPQSSPLITTTTFKDNQFEPSRPPSPSIGNCKNKSGQSFQVFVLGFNERCELYEQTKGGVKGVKGERVWSQSRGWKTAAGNVGTLDSLKFMSHSIAEPD